MYVFNYFRLQIIINYFIIYYNISLALFLIFNYEICC